MDFVCPVCERSSSHPKDREFGYCVHCHTFTGEQAPAEFLRPERVRDEIDVGTWISNR